MNSEGCVISSPTPFIPPSVPPNQLRIFGLNYWDGSHWRDFCVGNDLLALPVDDFWGHWLSLSAFHLLGLDFRIMPGGTEGGGKGAERGTQFKFQRPLILYQPTIECYLQAKCHLAVAAPNLNRIPPWNQPVITWSGVLCGAALPPPLPPPPPPAWNGFTPRFISTKLAERENAIPPPYRPGPVGVGGRVATHRPGGHPAFA